MDGEIDLRTADRDVLIGIIIRQQAIIDRLEKWVAQLEGRGKSGGSGRMPGLKLEVDGKPDQPKKPRKRRHLACTSLNRLTACKQLLASPQV